MSPDAEAALEKLRKSPMLRMSLGSRELFHSDFLAWLFEMHPSALSVFGRNERAYKVEREKKNVDLAFRNNDDKSHFLIVENKVKSFPDKEQLELYSKKFPGVEKRLLLTLLEPSFDPENLKYPWEILTYSKLAERLSKWVSENANELDHALYVRDYVEMIKNLGIVAAKYFGPSNEYWFGDQDEFKSLDAIGFGNSFLKFQAEQFAKDCGKELGKEPGSEFKVVYGKDKRCDGRHVSVFWEMNNASPCVTFTASVGPERPETKIEVQIQGKQYRRILTSQSLIDAISKNQSNETYLWDEIQKSQMSDWLFGSKVYKDGKRKLVDIHNGSAVGKKLRTSMTKRLCSYKNGAVYQYVNISTEQGDQSLNFSKLGEWIKGDLKYAFELLDRPDRLKSGSN